MKATFLRLEDGRDIEIENITEILTGSKYYWLDFDTSPAYKLRTSEYRLMSVEA